MSEENTEPTTDASDGKVSVRFKPHARGHKAGQLRRLDPDVAAQLVADGHAKYVGKSKG